MPEAQVKSSYVNPIKVWYDGNTKPPQFSSNYSKYKKGMLISIDNNQLYHNSIISKFEDLYQSFILALTGKKIDLRGVKKIDGDWYGDRVKLPSRYKLLDLISYKIPVMLCGVHNYRKDDIRSGGKEYCHSHFYVYNVHHYLPSNPVELADKEDKIVRHLSRYLNQRKRFQNMIRLTPVGHGEHQYTDPVTPTKLYDYLQSPNTSPEKDNAINYIANNRHLPNLQYPLTFIYLKKKP